MPSDSSKARIVASFRLDLPMGAAVVAAAGILLGLAWLVPRRSSEA